MGDVYVFLNCLDILHRVKVRRCDGAIQLGVGSCVCVSSGKNLCGGSKKKISPVRA